MDETTFQQELRELKQRVSEMSSNASPSPTVAQLSGWVMATAVQNDLFAVELRDVKTRLDLMQHSLSQHQSQRQQEQLDGSNHAALDKMADTYAGVQSLAFVVQSHHEDMAQRMHRLELAISGLRNATMFTPDSSETTYEDLTIADEVHHAEPKDALEPVSATPHEQHGVSVQQSAREEPLASSQDFPLSSLLESLQEQSIQAELQADDSDHNDSGDTELDHAESDHADFDSNVDDRSLSHWHADNCGHSHENQRPKEERHDETVIEGTTKVLANFNHQSYGVLESRDKQIATLEAIIKQQYLEQEERMAEIDHERSLRRAAEDAFQCTRDNLEDRLRDSEDAAAHWKDKAATNREGFEAMHQCNRELKEARDRALARLTHDLKQCEASRHTFMTRFVDENHRYRWLEERKFQSEEYLKQQLEKCERALKESEKNRGAEVAHAVKGRDEELEKLHAFCQEKDAVALQQGEIIAQGALILEERDAEIDRLNIDLSEAQRGREAVRNDCSKFKRTVEKRNEEIEDLKDDLRDEIDRRHRLEDKMKKDVDNIKAKAKSKDVRFSADAKQPAKPFAHAVEASSGHARRDEPSWTPEPIRVNARLPHEEDRASLWQSGNHTAPKHRFGATSPIASRRAQDDRRSVMDRRSGVESSQEQYSRLPESNTQHDSHTRWEAPRPSGNGIANAAQAVEQPRVHDSYRQHAQGTRNAHQQARAHPAKPRQPSQGLLKSMQAQAPTNGGLPENRRHALPLDAAWLPPLPSMGRAGSVPNLHAGSNPSNRHGAMNKPASMMDLRPQQKLQTYHAPSVETEAESAEDQGGSSLLEY